MATESIFGQTAEDMKDSGKMVSSTVKENTFYQIIQSKLVFGKTERESDGLSNINSMKMEPIKDK